MYWAFSAVEDDPMMQKTCCTSVWKVVLNVGFGSVEPLIPDLSVTNSSEEMLCFVRLKPDV